MIVSYTLKLVQRAGREHLLDRDQANGEALLDRNSAPSAPGSCGSPPRHRTRSRRPSPPGSHRYSAVTHGRPILSAVVSANSASASRLACDERLVDAGGKPGCSLQNIRPDPDGVHDREYAGPSIIVALGRAVIRETAARPWGGRRRSRMAAVPRSPRRARRPPASREGLCRSAADVERKSRRAD